MKPYMAFSRLNGSYEGAILVFAHNLKEAKKTAWNSNTFIHDICDTYFDLYVNLIKNGEHLFKEANQKNLNSDIPHVIESPTTCKNCELWGYELDENGYCESCAEEVADG